MDDIAEQWIGIYRERFGGYPKSLGDSERFGMRHGEARS